MISRTVVQLAECRVHWNVCAHTWYSLRSIYLNKMQFTNNALKLTQTPF